MQYKVLNFLKSFSPVPLSFFLWSKEVAVFGKNPVILRPAVEGSGRFRQNTCYPSTAGRKMWHFCGINGGKREIIRILVLH